MVTGLSSLPISLAKYTSRDFCSLFTEILTFACAFTIVATPRSRYHEGKNLGHPKFCLLVHISASCEGERGVKFKPMCKLVALIVGSRHAVAFSKASQEQACGEVLCRAPFEQWRHLGW